MINYNSVQGYYNIVRVQLANRVFRLANGVFTSTLRMVEVLRTDKVLLVTAIKILVAESIVYTMNFH